MFILSFISKSDQKFAALLVGSFLIELTFLEKKIRKCKESKNMYSDFPGQHIFEIRVASGVA